ncbi:tryptophan 7-halogenase [Streptomyces sp. NPDC048567]|uniref:tryptophan 7-halogenase n=1 Tax=Streptomyces sp. NPDC048567 TaxID=3365570 RepID=UPI0037197F28
MTDITETDVVVVGGGPGGSTVATLVARQGHRVVLLEKERFPRYQIGESLLPSTVQGICRLLGVSEELEQAGFPVKRGGTFRWGANPKPWTFDFGIAPEFADAAAPAYQVERMKFDQILLDNAKRTGVDVREEHTVTDVIEENGRVRGVSCTDADGVRREFRGRYVVDASGNLSRIHSRVGGKRQYSEFFRNLALFGYFTGGKRMPAPSSGNILAVAFSAGWFWYIPLSDELTSVGAVVHREALDRIQGDREEALKELIAECPMIADFLADAERVTSGPYGEIRVRKDYSYIQEKFSRPGLVLVGDAAGFIDPVFSSGVHLATYGGLLVARSLNTALRTAGETGIDEKTLFEEYEVRYRQEYMRFHEFLVSFYDMHSDEDSYFWKAKKVAGGTASELQTFVTLVGGGSSDERALVDSGSYGGRGDVDEALWSVAQAGANIQVQAATGSTVDEQVPVRDEGLVPSEDGMHWALPATAAA